MKKLFLLMLIFAVGLEAVELKTLTFEQVYLNKGEALLRPLPEITGWLDDSRYSELRDGKIFLVSARSGRSRVLLDPVSMKEKGPAKLDWLRPDDRSLDYSQLVFNLENDLYLWRSKEGALRRLTATADLEKNPVISPDGKRLAYTAGGNLYVCDLASGISTQLTFDGSEEILNGYASWVYYEEILGRASRYRAFDWSPDGTKIVFMRFDQSRVPQFPLFDVGGAYGRLEMQRYPKPGFPNPEVKIGVVDLAARRTEWIDFPFKGDYYLTILAWTREGKGLYLQWMNRGQKDWRIFTCNLAGKGLRQVYQETEKTWVEAVETDGFHALANGGMLLLSNKSGWRHLYLVRADGSERMITSGKWSVNRIEFVDEKKGQVFFSADKEDTTRSDLYRASIKGGPLQRLTRLPGSHRVAFSPGGSFYTDRCSSLQKPALMQLCGRDGSVVRRLGDSVAPAFSGYALGKAEIFRIPTGDGLQLPAIWYLPPGFAAGKKYPVVMSVYGGPGVRSVIDAFPRRLDDYYLAQQGIIVVKVDHRGSGHFGKQGTDIMHRCLGKWEISDYCSAVAYLRTLPFIEGGKIGITGGSYGGYVAALALAVAPDSFSCGIAEFGVMDWALYDSVYTERYMDLPAENPEGYRQASVLSHVSTYRGGLRLTHGSMDDNVHMQNTLQFLNAILDLGKTAELMIYPGERHGVRGRKYGESASSSLEFWKRKFFAEEQVGPVGQVGPVRQEKQE
jgi:dipeptidyl-peptidase-4